MQRLSFPALLCALLCIGHQTARADSFVVYAAASLSTALSEITQTWSAATGHTVKLSFAASSVLAKQIEAGAPAALYLAADQRSMDMLEKQGRLVTQSRVDLLGNQLVLITPKDRPHPLKLVMGFDLAAVLGDGRLASGDPAYVPAGQYAQEALTALGVWRIAEPRLVRTDSVRAALVLVERSEVPAGIVYATDVRASRGVVIAGTFPASSHLPIVYPMALITEFATPAARVLHAYLAGPAARVIFQRHGFIPLS